MTYCKQYLSFHENKRTHFCLPIFLSFIIVLQNISLKYFYQQLWFHNITLIKCIFYYYDVFCTTASKTFERPKVGIRHKKLGTNGLCKENYLQRFVDNEEILFSIQAVISFFSSSSSFFCLSIVENGVWLFVSR